MIFAQFHLPKTSDVFLLYTAITFDAVSTRKWNKNAPLSQDLVPSIFNQYRLTNVDCCESYWYGIFTDSYHIIKVTHTMLWDLYLWT